MHFPQTYNSIYACTVRPLIRGKICCNQSNVSFRRSCSLQNHITSPRPSVLTMMVLYVKHMLNLLIVTPRHVHVCHHVHLHVNDQTTVHRHLHVMLLGIPALRSTPLVHVRGHVPPVLIDTCHHRHVPPRHHVHVHLFDVLNLPPSSQWTTFPTTNRLTPYPYVAKNVFRAMIADVKDIYNVSVLSAPRTSDIGDYVHVHDLCLPVNMHVTSLIYLRMPQTCRSTHVYNKNVHHIAL